MYSHRALALIAGVALSAMLPISAAHACACCAEPGDRFDRTEAIDEFAQTVIGAVRFGSEARLYTTAADWAEQIKGITNPAESDAYTLKVARTDRAWTFDMSDVKGHTGQLTLQWPTTIHKFHADMTPLVATSGEYVATALYKEWRLESRVSGKGMFTFNKAAQSRAQLILHGTGNSCTSADEFTNWTLDVTGRGVRFRFFGALRQVK